MTEQAQTNAAKFYETWPRRVAAMRAAAPDMARGFGGLFQATMKEGVLSVREKELIALAIGLATRCTNCIFAHVEKALHAGATREQVLEAAAVAVMMQGGPTYTYFPEVVDALDALAATGEK